MAALCARRRIINTALLQVRTALLSSRAFSSGRGTFNDDDFESIFGKSSSSGKNPTDSTSGESDFWKSLVKDPTKDAGKNKNSSSSSSSWDFLKELNIASNKQKASPSVSRPSFRRLGDTGAGLDFISEVLEKPDLPATEKSLKKEKDLGDEEESILHSASFQLLRDSFQKASQSMQPQRDPAVGIKSLDDALGLDSGSLFSSQGAWSKPVDSRTLAEVEDGFYSTVDQAPAQDTKTYTYEELGEKLRKVQPPKDQLLFSATGLSFGDLRTRLQKIEQMETEAEEKDESMGEYKELRDCLDQLRSPKALAARRQLSYEELSFLNTIGTRAGSRSKIEYVPPKDDLLAKYYSEQQLSSKDRLKLEIQKLRQEFQTHEQDTGSPQVQVAILTARINNLNRHLKEGPNYKRDKHNRKGLNDMVQFRKRLLQYLRRRDWPAYCNVLTKLKLEDVILEKRARK